MKTVRLAVNVEVQIRKARVRHLRLTVRHGGVSLTLPYFSNYQTGLAFLKEKRSWILKKRRELEQAPQPFRSRGSAQEFALNQKPALEAIRECLRKYEAHYGVKAKKITIRNQKTRWGSCSRAGTLSFNYRLILLPERLREYVIAHEVCHLRAFNHSKDFWQLVAETLPEYRALRRELRQFGSK